MATLTASQSFHVRRATATATATALSSSSSHGVKALPLTRLALSPQKRLPSLSLRSSKPYLLPRLRVSAATSSIPPNPAIPTRIPTLSDSTRTITSLFTAAASISSLFLRAIESVSSKIASIAPNPSPEELAKIQSLRESLVCSAGPLFFAAIDYSRRNRRVSTPVSLVAGAITKWLDIYGGILMVRVLLSWFPNIPWDRQPLSAIRDLCDPYLNLFRNVIPPVFNTLDISPFFAFMLLGVFSTLLNAARFGVH